MLFYFTATGNSLYAAKHFDDVLISIPQEIHKENRYYRADRIGIVCPLYEFELPSIVREFIEGSVFDTDYFYIVMTYGMHHGGCAVRTAEYFENMGKHIDYFNTVKMLDNALPVFDMDEQRKLDPEKKADEHLALIKTDLDTQRRYIQPALKEETDFYEGYKAHAGVYSSSIEQPLYKVSDRCVGCGICTRVCPEGCITLNAGRPVFSPDSCIGCMACIHACPQKAIGYAVLQEKNPDARYRHPDISLHEIILSNRQN